MEKSIAKDLLSIGAVFLRPEQPFTWASGIKSPIYCDNRLTLTAVEGARARGGGPRRDRAYEVSRGRSADGHLDGRHRPCGHYGHDPRSADGLCAQRREATTAAANASRAVWKKGQKVVVIEDLISTAGSCIEVVEALREAGAEVLGVASIFTYGMQKGLDRLAAAGVTNYSLSNLDTLVEVAAAEGTSVRRTASG